MPDVDIGAVYATLVLKTENLFKNADAAVAKLNNLGAKGKQIASDFNKAFENVSGLAKYQNEIDKATKKYDEQKRKVEELAKEMQSMRDSLPKGDVANTLISEKFGAQLDDAKTKMAEYKEAVRRATAEMDGYVLSQREAAVATAGQKAATLEAQAGMKDMSLASGTMAVGLRSLSGITGGAVGNLADMAAQVVYLRRVMQASRTGASEFTAALTGIVGVAMLVATAIMKIVQAHNEEIEARKKAVREAVEYIDTMKQESFAIESSLKTLKSSASSTDEITAAKNDLARIFPDLVIGWTNEGNAILASNEVLKHRLELAEKWLSIQREIAASNVESTLRELERARAEEEAARRTSNYHRMVSQTAETLEKREVASIELRHSLEEESRVTLEILDIEERLKRELSARIQTQIAGYDDLSSAQKAIINNEIAMALSSENLIGADKRRTAEIAASALAAANNTQKQKEVEDQLTESAKKASEFAKAMGDSITNMDRLSSAYATLHEGEQLSLAGIIRLIDEYPELAKYIAETGDLTLKNGGYLKEVAAIRRAVLLQEMNDQIMALEVEKTAIEERIKQHNRLIETLNNEFAAYWLVNLAAKDQAALDAVNEKINVLKANLKPLENFDVTVGIKTPKASKAPDKNEAYQEALKEYEYEKQMRDMSLAEQLSHLEKINALYKKSKDEQHDMDLKLKDLRGKIRGEELSYERDFREHRKAMGEDVLAEEIARNEAIRDSSESTARERWAADEWLYKQKKQAVEDEMSDRDKAFAHRRALGENTVADEIAWNNSILANDKYTTEQQAEALENLYSLNRQAINDAMAVDELRLRERNLGREKDLHAEIDMLDKWLLYYTLTDEEIVSIMERRYGLQNQLIAAQEKEAVTALKAAQDAQISRLNAQKKAWQDWEASVTASINGYLRALDDMEKQEDRADKLAKENREMEAVRLKLAYEQDANNQRRLQEELTRLESEQQKRLAKESRDDAKQALRDALTAVKDESRERQNAISDEISRIKDLTSSASLPSSFTDGSEAALRAQISKSVEAALSSYQVEFKGVGKSLGQSIEEGLQSALDRITQTFEQFRQLQNSPSAIMAAAANAAADRYEQSKAASVVTYAPTINFYQPVQSPYESARAVADIERRMLEGYYM